MKTALITGGSTGIGKAIALALAKQGCFVNINYLDTPEEAQAVVEEMVALGGQGQAIQADVTQPKAVKQLMKAAASPKGSLDILINNASLEINNYIWDLKDEEWERSVGVTLFGAFYCAKYALPYLAHSPNGKIINISSIHDTVPRKAAVSYCSGKAGLLMMTKVLALELAPYNIQVNAVSPGLTLTDRTASILKEDGSVDPENAVVSANPMKRPATVEEVAAGVLYLCSEEAGYTSGTTLYIDGAYRHNLCPERTENMFEFLDNLT